MPNTKSAERRMRNSARKHLHNRSLKSRLHTLERAYLHLLGAGKKDDAAAQKRTPAVKSRFRSCRSLLFWICRMSIQV